MHSADWDLWGEYAQDKEMSIIPPTVGNIYELKRYYTMNYDGVSITDAYYTLPEIMQNINVFHLSNLSKFRKIVCI